MNIADKSKQIETSKKKLENNIHNYGSYVKDREYVIKESLKSEKIYYEFERKYR